MYTSDQMVTCTVKCLNSRHLTTWLIIWSDTCKVPYTHASACNHLTVLCLPSVLWHCWLGGRQGIRPVKNWAGEVLEWLPVWSEVQTCIWPSWCHCHTLSLASVKSRLVLPFWHRLTRVVPDKGPLNGCVCCLGLLGQHRKKVQKTESLTHDLYWETTQWSSYHHTSSRVVLWIPGQRRLRSQTWRRRCPAYTPYTSHHAAQ